MYHKNINIDASSSMYIYYQILILADDKKSIVYTWIKCIKFCIESLKLIKRLKKTMNSPIFIIRLTYEFKNDDVIVKI